MNSDQLYKGSSTWIKKISFRNNNKSNICLMIFYFNVYKKFFSSGKNRTQVHCLTNTYIVLDYYVIGQRT